jgi:hypothetical protein
MGQVRENERGISRCVKNQAIISPLFVKKRG